ncbi:MAG: hypothetical protein AAF645_15135 [Myxococcota bacterium]
MSAAQVQKLEALLQRVTTRRNEPRPARGAAPAPRSAAPETKPSATFAPRPASQPPPARSIADALESPTAQYPKPAATKPAASKPAASKPAASKPSAAARPQARPQPTAKTAPKAAPAAKPAAAKPAEPRRVARGSFAPPRQAVAKVTSPHRELTFGDLLADALSLRPED